MISKNRAFRKGAASFYIVAFSTLILVVIATSFAAMIISEVTRTSNDDLAQSAYDSALAGIEDAKLALNKYQQCLKDEPNTSAVDSVSGTFNNNNCGHIRWAIEKSDSCGMVSNILGRTITDDGVFLGEVSSTGSGMEENNMKQYYTCVKIKTDLTSFVSHLSKEKTTSVIRPQFGSNDDADEIKMVRISWRPVGEGAVGDELKYSFIKGEDGDKKVIFPSEAGDADPQMISVGIVQTGSSFNLDSFTKTEDRRTNRGLLYLVPTDNLEMAKKTEPDNYVGVYDGNNRNTISEDQVVKSNDQTVKNLPLVVYCDPNASGNDNVCSVDIMLPKPLGDGVRNDDTFMVIVSLPYVDNNTIDSIAYTEFCTTDDCYKSNPGGEEDGDREASTLTLKGQVLIDSTGRANNLYRRVQTYLESADTYNPYPLFALELLGEDDGYSLKKTMTVTCEISEFGGDGSGCS